MTDEFQFRSRHEFFDDVVFDRLADGELSAEERRELLTSLDAQPSGWRQCALAFLEAQAWRHDLRSVVNEQTDRPDVSLAASKESGDRRRVSPWLALAASVMVAFTLGTLVRSDWLSTSGALQPPAPLEQVAESDVQPSAESLETEPVDDALTMWVRDETGQPRRLRVPLVDASDMERRTGIRFDSTLPADVRERLQQDGFQVESKRRYAPLWLENGRPLVVPVEDTRIVPIDPPVY